MSKTLKHDIYQSYAMVHPDGTFMCYCDEKKAHWYVKRNIAKWTGEKKFQLLFEPNGYGKSRDPFYTQLRDNHCVVCGKVDNLNKHHVVPYVFRKRFPIEYKSNNHHDVLSTCVDCHENYETHATLYKKELAQKANVAFDSALTPEDIKNASIKKARKVLEKYHNGIYYTNSGEPAVIPKERVDYLKNLAQQKLTARANQDFWADVIMDDVLSKNNLQEFIENWRLHFLNYAKPQYLPQFWSVTHKEIIS